MEGLQAFALVVSLTELVLLVTVLAARAANTDAFVSTEMEDLTSFRLLLTVFTLNSILLSLLYVWARSQRGGCLYTAAAGAVAGVVGWGMLSLSPVESSLHMVGVATFLFGQGALLLMQFALASALSAVFLTGFAATAVCAALFLALDFAGNRAGAAWSEWIALVLNSLLLVLFWWANPFQPQATQARPEAAPLMPVQSGWV